MGRSLARTLPFVLVAVLIGAGAAYGVSVARKSGNNVVANASPSPAPAESPIPSPLPTPSESASPVPSPSPLATPTPAPVVAPSPRPSQPAVPGPVPYPREISAGNAYSYSGHGHRAVLAQDSRDSGTTVCAGINESTQAFPAGYEGVFFVAVQFPDGNRLSAGYARTPAGRFDFGQLNNDSTGVSVGSKAAVSPGSHNYCVSRSGGAWVMSDDGVTIFSTTAEGASSTSGAVLRFENLTGPDPTQPTPAPQTYMLMIPGFHDILVGGAAPTQLVGSSIYIS